jgi:hypothetical protein
LVSDQLLDGSLDWGLSPDAVWDTGGFPVPLTPEDRQRIIGRVREGLLFAGFRSASDDQR